MKKIISIILATVLMATALPFSASAASLYFNQSSFSLGVGESVVVSTNLYSKISRSTTKYVSKKTLNKKSIKIKGLKEGKTVLTAKKGSQKKKITVTVKKAPTSIKLNKTNVTIAIGESVDFNSVVPKGTASKLRKYSYVSNTTTVDDKKAKVCTYCGSGIFKGLNVGTSTIKCTTYNGKSAEATIKVIKSRQYTTAKLRKDVENKLFEAVESLGIKEIYQSTGYWDSIGFKVAKERSGVSDIEDSTNCCELNSSRSSPGYGELHFSDNYKGDFKEWLNYYYMNDIKHFKESIIEANQSWPCSSRYNSRSYVKGNHPPQIMVYWWESNPKGAYDVLSYYFIWW